MDRTTREHAILAAEQAVGSVLPPKIRAALIDHGRIDTGETSDFARHLALHDTPSGKALFATPWGELMVEAGGWDFDAILDEYEIPCEVESQDEMGWELQERAFIVGRSTSGDPAFLSPDEHGVARRLVFGDHETGILFVRTEDIEAVLPV